MLPHLLCPLGWMESRRALELLQEGMGCFVSQVWEGFLQTYLSRRVAVVIFVLIPQGKFFWILFLDFFISHLFTYTLKKQDAAGVIY